VKYLLDVNSLLALGVEAHEFHASVARWVARIAKRGADELATCSITELGFVRVLGQAAHYHLSVTLARELLMRMKRSDAVRFVFLPDDRDISHLPRWAKGPKQIIDAHLLDLAKSHAAQLATLDRHIASAFLIP
jgi:uncharacterized protein